MKLDMSYNKDLHYILPFIGALATGVVCSRYDIIGEFLSPELVVQNRVEVSKAVEKCMHDQIAPKNEGTFKYCVETQFEEQTGNTRVVTCRFDETTAEYDFDCDLANFSKLLSPVF